MTHTECKESEVFVGNTETQNELPHLQGKVKFRKGIQAYDIHQRKINPTYMCPLFVAKEDFHIYDKIMIEISHK